MPKASFLDEYYQFSNSKKSEFPAPLQLENETGSLVVNSCLSYLTNLRTYHVVESDENMRLQLYYLPCISEKMQSEAVNSKSSQFDGDLIRVITDELDLTTFRSSLRRKLTENVKTFNDLKYEHSLSGNKVEVKRLNWKYVFILLGKGDYDNNGFEDLMVMFIDQALSSSYYSSDILVLHKKEGDRYWTATDAVELLYSE